MSNMIAIADVLTAKQAELLKILHFHHGKELHVFGSAARGECSPDSDIDFLVTMEKTASLFDQMKLRRSLEAFLGRHVDLVDMNALATARSGFGFRRRESILKEARLVCR